MPTAPPSRCHCGQRATQDGRCPRHRRTGWNQPSANTLQLTRAERARIRAQQLRDEPQCRACGNQNNLHADHIIPVAEGGATDDPANLQTLCQPCHATKTAAEAARGRARNRP